MKNLIYKELTLSINKFFYILPILLSLLLFIPNWLFLLIFMYFLWISVPQIYASYQTNKDNAFTLVLPVSRRDIAKAKGYTLIVLELYHILLAVIFGVIHNLIYGSTNFFFDVNPAFFGAAFIIFGVFNAIFLPQYFKTGYKYGKPIIIAIAVTTVLAAGTEILVGFYPWFTNIFEHQDIVIQILLLLGSTMIYIILNIVSIYQSARNYEKIK